MAYRLTEDDKLIIEPEMKNYRRIMVEEVGIFLWCWFMYSINFPLKYLIIIYVMFEVLMNLGVRLPFYSKYILDSRGITRIFWKYEKTIFWGQFETKRIEKERQHWTDVAVFSIESFDRYKWYQNEEYSYFWRQFSWNYIEFSLREIGPNDIPRIDYDLFITKMKDWNVDVPYVPWPEEKAFRE